MSYFNRLLSLFLIIVLGVLLGGLGCAIWDKKPPVVERVVWGAETQWITAQPNNSHFYARHTFYVADTVEAGWLQISANDDFSLYVNGRLLAKDSQYLLRDGVGMAGGSDQNVNDSLPYPVITDPIWSAQVNDWKLTIYVDLTAYLHPGKNVITLNVQSTTEHPRVAIQGKIYPTAEDSPIEISTGASLWRIANLAENRQGLRWFDLDFPDQGWTEANMLGSVQETTYSRVSSYLFDRPLQGLWITGSESVKGEVWLRKDWHIPHNYQRAFIRFAGEGEYALLINGSLVNRYPSNFKINPLHLYEVTNFLHPGVNVIAVRLARPLGQRETAVANNLPEFFLDGWIEPDLNTIAAPIYTDSTWSSLAQPSPGWFVGKGQAESAIIVRSPNPQAFQRIYEGDAYRLNYPNSLWHYSLWQLGGISLVCWLAWVLGRYGEEPWELQSNLDRGTALLLPGTLFLIGMSLLKHRYAQAESGLLFVQPQSLPLLMLGFVGIVGLTWICWRVRSQPNLNGSMQNLVQTLQPRWKRLFLLGVSVGLAVGLVNAIARFSSILAILCICFGLLGILLVLLWATWLRHTSYGLKFKEVCNASQQGNQMPGISYQGSEILSITRSWLLVPLNLNCYPQHRLALFLIVGVGLVIRLYHLGSVPMIADESTSLDAARSILRDGIPQLTSGIWYTRSPAYHYMLALWLWLVGDSITNARLLTVLWGVATLVVVFVIARQISGKIWIALLVTAILAIDPWAIANSRIIRFYQPVQFMTLLSFGLFLKGFIKQRDRRYQYLFFVSLTLALLLQEVTVILLPCFLLGFICFYRPFRLSVDWPIVASSVMVMIIFIFDITVFNIKCLTPLVALSTTTGSIIQPHLWDITSFAMTLFVGPHRMYIPYSLFFILGLIYFLRRRDSNTLFIFSFVFVYLTLATILIMEVRSRYFYPIYPLFIVLSIYSAICILSVVGQHFEMAIRETLPLKNVALGCLVLLLLGNMEFSGILASYRGAIVAGPNELAHLELYRYIQEHQQPGDIIATTAPQGAVTVLEQVDYFLRPNLRFDALYWRNGEVVDRWAGGAVVTNLDQLNHILPKATRVWLVLRNEDPIEKRNQLGKFDVYLHTLGQPVFETYSGRIRLWQPKDGLLPRVPNQGKDIGSY